MNQRFNDDLLISEEDQIQVEQLYPSLNRILDFPTLRDTFMSYDVPANLAKKKSRRAGLTALGLGMLALIGAASEPLYHSLPHNWILIIGIILSSCGIFSLIVGFFGVMFAKPKQTWLCNRMIGERLRQLHFQIMLGNLEQIAISLDDIKNLKSFLVNREKFLESFKSKYSKHPKAQLLRIIDSNGGKETWLHQPQSVSHDSLEKLDRHGFFQAFRELRLEHQIQYTTYKLSPDPISLNPTIIQQREFLKGASLFCILGVFFIHLLIALGIPLVFIASEEINKFITHPLLHIGVMWMAIIALALRTAEEGLQPAREVERYRRYLNELVSILDRYNTTKDLSEKIRLMEETERLSFEEMRMFLISNHEAKFVI